MWKKLFDRKARKERRKIEQWELDLLKNTLQKLPTEYHNLIKQVDAGLLKSVLSGLGDLPHWKTFGFNSEIVNKYDKPQEPSFDLTNIFVFDRLSNTYLKYIIGCASGLLIGYSINSDKEFDIDVYNIDVRYFQKRIDVPDGYHQIKEKFTPSEQKLINPSDVYEIELGQKRYYHLMDVKDGDFIGMDDGKNVYLITHDPFEIKLLELPLVQILSGDANLHE